MSKFGQISRKCEKTEKKPKLMFFSGFAALHKIGVWSKKRSPSFVQYIEIYQFSL
jgi:hypothetical protein